MTAEECAWLFFFFFQAEDGIRDYKVTGVQTCALPISSACPPTIVGTGFGFSNSLTAARRRQATPSDHGQLLGPQGPRGADVAGPPQALSRALRPYQFFLAEHGRTLLSRSDGEAHPAWRLS